MTTTPDTDRQARREQLAAIVRRTLDGKQLTEPEAFALAGLVNIEQDDGDQAREQRDQAAASLTDLRNDLYRERRAHEEHRRSLAMLHNLHPDADWLNVSAAVTSVLRARDRDRRFLTEARRLRDEACGALDAHQLSLADALGHPTGRTWAELIGAARILRTDVLGSTRSRAETAEQEARDARRGEAEAVRAREAAERRATESRTYAERADREGERLAELLGQAEARVRAVERSAVDARIRSGRSIADARRNRDAWRNARKRAAMLSAEVTRRAPLTGEYAARARTAEAVVRHTKELLTRRTETLRKRAERAEATLTAERLAQQRRIETTITAIRHAGLCADCEINLRAAIEAALGDPQPATEPERCGQYGGHGEYCDYPREPGSEQCAFHAAEARTHDAEPADPCAHGCRQAADDLTRLGQEIDAEPRGGITDHTYEAADGLCGADFLGHICGAARDDHDQIEPEQPAEPLLRGTAPLVLSLDIAPAEIAALLSKVRRAARAMRKAGLL